MPEQYTWHSILGIVRKHKKDLISAHIVAILAAERADSPADAAAGGRSAAATARSPGVLAE